MWAGSGRLRILRDVTGRGIQYGGWGTVVSAGGRECAGRAGGFRQEMFWCLWRCPDALFELADAVLTAGQAVPLPYLSLRDRRLDVPAARQRPVACPRPPGWRDAVSRAVARGKTRRQPVVIPR